MKTSFEIENNVIHEHEQVIEMILDAGAPENDTCQEIMIHLEGILHELLRILPRTQKIHFWALDDLFCDDISKKEEKLTFNGKHIG